MKEKEIWKSVDGYEGFYEVSNLGNVKSLPRKMWNGRNYFTSKERILKPGFSGPKEKDRKRQRLMVILSKDNKKENCLIHHLVARAFLGERPDGMVICHNDGNHLNNNKNNLRYDTQQQNVLDIYRHGGNYGKGRLNTDEVLEIRRLYKNGESINEITKKFKTQRNSIKRIIDKETYQWLDDYGNII